MKQWWTHISLYIMKNDWDGTANWLQNRQKWKQVNEAISNCRYMKHIWVGNNIHYHIHAVNWSFRVIFLTAWVRFPSEERLFLFPTASRLALGPTKPPIQWVPRVQQPGRKTYQTPPSSAEVKNGGAIPPLPHVFMVQSLIRHRDFIFFIFISNTKVLERKYFENISLSSSAYLLLYVQHGKILYKRKVFQASGRH
jgi:hypothetical protein